MKQCASIRGSQNTHYPPRLFLYSHLCLALPLPHRPPPQPLFVTTAILKAIHAAPRLSSCIAAFSPAPRFLFFFLPQAFYQIRADGGRWGEDGWSGLLLCTVSLSDGRSVEVQRRRRLRLLWKITRGSGVSAGSVWPTSLFCSHCDNRCFKKLHNNDYFPPLDFAARAFSFSSLSKKLCWHRNIAMHCSN